MTVCLLCENLTFSNKLTKQKVRPAQNGLVKTIEWSMGNLGLEKVFLLAVKGLRSLWRQHSKGRLILASGILLCAVFYAMFLSSARIAVSEAVSCTVTCRINCINYFCCRAALLKEVSVLISTVHRQAVGRLIALRFRRIGHIMFQFSQYGNL